MALAAGSRLDSYEIIALLGAGGMGEVYRARDLTLKREVAVKVLPAHYALEPDRLRRSLRWIRATSRGGDAGRRRPRWLAGVHTRYRNTRDLRSVSQVAVRLAPSDRQSRCCRFVRTDQYRETSRVTIDINRLY